MVKVLRESLELMHPFMPFITEEIWQKLPHQGVTIMLAHWPKPEEKLKDSGAEQEMVILIEAITAVRRIRGEMNVPPGKKAEVILVAGEDYVRSVLERNKAYVQGLANAEVTVLKDLQEKPDQVASAVTKGVEIFVPLKGLIDIDKEVARLTKELKSIETDLAGYRANLATKASWTRLPQMLLRKRRPRNRNWPQSLQL
ncbi:hypothetical protein N752_28410 [Desulforamulus aquiferis]|nr:hypothetical protein N752_28410 [Desulforamulus aquiferis]